MGPDSFNVSATMPESPAASRYFLIASLTCDSVTEEGGSGISETKERNSLH